MTFFSIVLGKPSPFKQGEPWKRDSEPDVTQVFSLTSQDVEGKKSFVDYENQPVYKPVSYESVGQPDSRNYEQPANYQARNNVIYNRYQEGQAYDSNNNALTLPAGYSPFRSSELQETPSYYPTNVEHNYYNPIEQSKLIPGIERSMPMANDNVLSESQGNAAYPGRSANYETTGNGEQAGTMERMTMNMNGEPLAPQYSSERPYSADASYFKGYNPYQNGFSPVENQVGYPQEEGSRKSNVPQPYTQNSQTRQDLSWMKEDHPGIPNFYSKC